MKKGFDYWATNSFTAVIRTYWLIYAFYYLISIWAAYMLGGNPFIFLILGILPYVFLHIVKAIHSPIYNIEESIKKIDPELYALLSESNVKPKGIVVIGEGGRFSSALMYAALLRTDLKSKDQRIKSYVENNKKVNNAGMYSLSAWVLTFIVMIFYFYSLR